MGDKIITSKKTNKLLFILLIFIALQALLYKVECSHCDHVLYDPVSNCANHPLRIGYYASPECGSLHTLADSDSRPNADFARLNHPASYVSHGETKYHEYAAGSYLSVKLSKQAQIYAIAMQGSPDGLKNYPKSFQMAYKITNNSLTVGQAPTTTSEFYKENGTVRQFAGNMQNTMKFSLANPFFAEEVLVYPLFYQGDRVFRMELYGCYLGKLTVPSSVGMLYPATFLYGLGQSTSSSSYQYYLNIKEPNGTVNLFLMSGMMNYTFLSTGLATVTLGVKNGAGWMAVDEAAVTVQGPISSLKLKVDSNEASLHKKSEGTYMQFRLEFAEQPYQIRKADFLFGDGTSCTINYCMKQYTRGVFVVNGTASNDFYRASQITTIVACPSSAVSVTYDPAINVNGNAIKFNGTISPQTFTVTFYALWSTLYEVRLNGNLTQSDSFNSNGWTNKVINLPAGLTPPAQYSLLFNYTDFCEQRSYAATVLVDEEISGLSLRLNQTFKQELIEQVPYYFKNKPVDIYIDVAMGTSVSCSVTISDPTSTAYAMTEVVNDKVFLKTFTFSSPGNTFPTISATCSNRPNLAQAQLPSTQFDFQEVPEPLTNFSLTLSSSVISNVASVTVYMAFGTGNNMNCSVNSTSASILQSYSYSTLLTTQTTLSNGHKRYHATYSSLPYSPSHMIQVTCRNILTEVRGERSLEVQIPISGVDLTVPNFACFGTTFSVISSITLGKPVAKELLIDSIKKLEYPSSTTNDNTFSVTSSKYASPGFKGISVSVWNTVSPVQQTSTQNIRIAKTITNLDLKVDFNISSPQGLPDRPSLVVPANEIVTFTALVTPADVGYYYHWSIEGPSTASASQSVTTFSYIFTSVGSWKLRLVGDGCNNITIERNLTVVAPISDFSLVSDPTPETMVNKTTLIRAQYAAYAYCLELDFGDDSAHSSNCKNNTGDHPLNCFTFGMYCSVNHVYDRNGVFTVKFTASNDLFKLKKQVNVTAKSCYNPVIEVIGDSYLLTGQEINFTASNAIVLRSNLLDYNVTSVAINCDFSNTYSIIWKAFSAKNGSSYEDVNRSDSSLLLSNSLFNFRRSDHELAVPCCILPYGVFSISVEVRVSGNVLTDSFKTEKIFNAFISHTDPVALLENTRHRVYGYNTMVKANASGSYDPDKFTDNLMFAWFCRDVHLEPRDLSMLTKLPLLNYTNFSLPQPIVGCLGHSAGRIDVGDFTDVLEINSKLLQTNHTIELTVVVSNVTSVGLRRSNTSKSFLVLTKETPYLEIRCIENCESPTNPQSRITLHVQCYGDACVQNPSYKWTLFKENSTHNITIELDSKLHSFDDEKDLRMKPGALEPGTKYILIIRGTGVDGSYYETSYSFVTNRGPTNGTCSVVPTSGVAVFQQMSIDCNYWTDNQLPLSYEMALLHDAAPRILCDSFNETCRANFPDGYKDNTTLKIRIRIYDSLKMYSELTKDIKIYSSSCDSEIYPSSVDCVANPLRVGYYNTCGELHILRDSNNKPNANFARLNHPAFINSKFYEYSAGDYLEIKLAKVAHLHAIAIQGSPNALRYYLTSFELWYETVVKNLNVALPSNVVQGLYKEDGVKKVFTGTMNLSNKFTFKNHFYSDKIRIFPISHQGDKVFRVEVYGCYLGKLSISEPVFVNMPTVVNFENFTISAENTYYLMITEPSGASSLLVIKNETQHTFTSHGKARIDLGLKHSSGWISIDYKDLDVLGPITGLTLSLDGYPYTPYKRTNYKTVQFSVQGITDASQITSINCNINNSTSCTRNNCIKTLSHGLYKVNCTASNGLFHQNLSADIISCPLSAMAINYSPAIYQGGIGIAYKGNDAVHSFSVDFFALWTTNYAAYFDGLKMQNETLVEAAGWTTRVIQLPASLVAPSLHSLVFNYTDSCGFVSKSDSVFIDEQIRGLTLEVNQTFKLELIEKVSQIFKNHSVDFNFKFENGTTVSCNVTIDELPHNLTANVPAMNRFSETISVSNKKFSITQIFNSSGHSHINISCKCWNRLNNPYVELPVTIMEVRKVPERLTNFSLDVSKRILNSSEVFQLFFYFGSSEEMTCNVTSNSSGVTKTHKYEELLQTEAAASGSRKSFKVNSIAEALSPYLLLSVTCRNVLNEVKANITVNVLAVSIQGLSIDFISFMCHGSPIVIERNVTAGSPVYDAVFIDGNMVVEKVSFEHNITLKVDSSLYGIAGVKNVSLRAANSASNLQTVGREIRIAMPISDVDVMINFTLASPQGLSDRPYLILPVSDEVNFTAVVTPMALGYFYKWTINGVTEQTSETTWSFSFPTIGTYAFQLSVSGCNEVTLQRNITVISPIEAFTVRTNPSPECVVNQTTVISISHAKHSECLVLDFGDGSPRVYQCKSNITSSFLNCFTHASICTIEHVYKRSGTYNVKVIASNQLFARTVQIAVNAKACHDPVITIQGNGTDIVGGFQSLLGSFSATRHQRSQPVIFTITKAKVDCEFSPSYSIHWKAFSLGLNSTVNKSMLLTEGHPFLVPNSTITFQSGNHEMQIPCCLVRYGDLIVTAEIQMTGHYLIGGFKSQKVLATFVDDTDLEANLVEKSHRHYAYNTTITLNASLSRDPDRYSNLTFTWYCRDASQESRDVFSIPDLPMISREFFMKSMENASTSFPTSIDQTSIQNISSILSTPSTTVYSSASATINNRTSLSLSSPSSKARDGCFGVPAGILNVPKSAKELSFNSMHLTGNRTIEFSVLVEGNNPFRKRQSKANRKISVFLPLTPIFELRCTDNCQAKIDPSHKFSLMTICQRGACQNNATFKWTLVQFNYTSRSQIQLNNLLYSTDDFQHLYMKPNVLTPGSNYSLVLRATAPDGSYYEQQYLIQVNIQPLNGSCIVDPIQGEAVSTAFNINCSGWIDSELPLTFEVAHFNDVLTTIVCRHHSQNCRTLLPIAATKDSILNLRIRITDSMGMFTEVYQNVTMNTFELTLNKLKSCLAQLGNITNAMEAARFIGAVTSVYNHKTKGNATAEELQLKIEFRDKATKILIAMVNSSSDDVIAPLIAMLAEVPSEYTQASAAASTEALSQMVNGLIEGQQSVIFRDIVSRSKSLIAAMGMVMKSTSVNLDPLLKVKNESNFTDNPLRWTTSEGRKIVLLNTKYTERLVDTMLQRMSPVELPVDILTTNLGINIEKKTGTKMNQTTNIYLMDGKITLPSLQDMNLNENMIVSSITKFTTFNSYFWQYSSKLINSSLIDFQLKSSLAILGVSNTKQPVLMSIPRKLERPIQYHHWTFREITGNERVNFHTLKVQHDNSLHIEFKPMNFCMDYEIYIKYGGRPSREDFYKNWTLPDLRTCGGSQMQETIRANICSIYQNIVNELNEVRVNDTESNMNCTLMALLEQRVKDVVKPCELYPYRVFLLDSETKNGTYVFGIYEKNGTVSHNTSSAELLNATTSCQLIDNINQSSYFIRSFTSKCRFWNAEFERWETYGCQVGEESDATNIQCKCNHLTSFASDFLIAPNPIDMDKVIEGFKNIHNNVSVVVLLSLLFGIFALLVVRLRRLDKLDANKIGVVDVQHDPSDSYKYLVITITGARVNAGTTANVFCSLNNSEKKGEPRVLIDLEKPAFQRDQINAFVVSYKEPIENITDIRIWHDNQGDSPSWYLSRVYIEDLQTSKTYSFICEQWLAVEFDDGLIDRSIGVASKEDHQIFAHIFTTKTAKDFSDQHLWLSLFLKRPHDTFTRVQRVTCCMALLFLTMLASAMFFQLGNDTKYLWKIGSLVIDYKGIIIGIQSGLVALPISAFVLAIFRNAESFELYKKRRESRKRDGSIIKRGKLLPCGFLIIGWFLAISAILGSAVIVLFYSMQWGNDKSQQFVIAVFTSFLESAFIIQPFKLIVLAIILAAVLKRSQEESDVLETYKLSSNVQTLNLKDNDIKVSNLEPKPLTKEQQQFARKRRFMEIRLRLFLQEFISYMIFLMFLGLVVRGYRDNDGYYFSKALRDDIVHKHFETIQDIPGVWTWVQNHFIPAIYSQDWYNGNNFSDFKMTRNQEAYRIGLARIRQLRVKHNSCVMPDDVKGIVHHCNAGYSFENNEERNFKIGWKNASSGSKRKRRGVEDDTNYDADTRREVDASNVLQYFEMIEDYENHLKKSQNGLLKAGLRKMPSKFKNTFGFENDRSSSVNEDGSRYFESKEEESMIVTDGLPTDRSEEYPVHLPETGFTNDLPQVVNFLPDDDEDADTILKRSRRALKFKIKRKTIQTSSVVKHPEAVSIDEQYLLPNGQVRQNKDHWIYNDMSSLRGFPYYGYFATYSGGGYVASLSTDIDFARATAMALEQDSWVDVQTRALFFEFSVYNANLNFFATGFVMIEVLPTGSVVPNANIRVFKLYRYVGVFGKLVMASEIILVLCLFFFIYKECRHMYRLGCAYFKLFWSWIEITIAVALFTALILRGFSWYEADKNLMKLRRNTEQFINFHYTVVADDALLIAITVICFFSTLKVIKIIDVFPTIVSLKGTLRRCMKPLINYALPFSVAFCAFGFLSHLLFHNTTLFNSYLKTAETQLLMLIGGSVYYTLRDAHEIFGPLFFVLFAAWETFILLNVFLSILNEGIAENAHWNGEMTANEFYDFIEERASLMLRSFAVAMQKTMAKAYRKPHVIAVGECSTKRSRFMKNSINMVPEHDGKDAEMMKYCDLIMNRLDNKLCENFEVEKDDAKYLLTLLVKVKKLNNKNMNKKEVGKNI